MDIVDAVVSLGVTISNWFGVLIRTISNFFSGLIEIISFVLSLIKTLVYGIGSLLSGVWRLTIQVFDGGVFSSVGSAFSELSIYIGVPATVFIASLFLLIIVRIAIAFVFKLFRLNIDYHTLSHKSGYYSFDDTYKSLKKSEK